MSNETKHTITVPQGSGVEGFLHAIKTILNKRGVKSIVVNSRGTVTYSRVAGTVSDSSEVPVNFDHLLPYNIIRNREVRELLANDYPHKLVMRVLDTITDSGAFPINFVVGMSTVLWKWLGCESYDTKKFLCGIPVLYDKDIPSGTLLCCAAATREANVANVTFSIKVEMLNTLGGCFEVDDVVMQLHPSSEDIIHE